MSENEHLPIIKSPCFNLDTALGKIALTWMNTRMRFFDDQQFNHIEYRADDGSLRGLLVSPELFDEFHENNYPMLYMPFVDEATFNWFVDVVSVHMNEELEQLFED